MRHHKRPVTLMKRDPNTVVFLWILQNLSEYLFWRTSTASSVSRNFDLQRQTHTSQWTFLYHYVLGFYVFLVQVVLHKVLWLLVLTLSWRRPLSYRNQSIDLRSKSVDWFLHDNGLGHERVKSVNSLKSLWILIMKTIGRSQSSWSVLWKSVQRNFAKFTGKHLCQSLFF